jgi:transketolase
MKFQLNRLSKIQKKLRQVLIEHIYQNNYSHLGSCLSSLDIIYFVYYTKKAKEKFVLSNGHAALALYTVLQNNKLINSTEVRKLNIHPDRNAKKNIDVSTGSLGQGLPISVGMALANPQINTYCLISDGECAEGSIWESLRIIQENKITNLKLILSVNGLGAYCKISKQLLKKRLLGFNFKIKEIDGHNMVQLKQSITKKYSNPTIIYAHTSSQQLPFLKGLDSHYLKMSPKDYRLAQTLLK